MIKIVDLEVDYGAILGEFSPPEYQTGASYEDAPYATSLQKYEDAKVNRNALQQAIDDAYNEGYSEVRFKKSTLTLAYEWNRVGPGTGAMGNGDKLIELKSNTIYDFQNLFINVYYDSKTMSPYQVNQSLYNKPWNAHGRVFAIEDCVNTTLRNLKMLGEQRYRAYDINDTYTNSGGKVISEKWMEHTGGVNIGGKGGNIKIENCDISGFTGACVAGSGHGVHVVANGFRYFNKGYYNPDTKIIDVNTKSYHTAWSEINRQVLKDEGEYLPDFVEFVRTCCSSYFWKYNSSTFQVIFADENYETISDISLEINDVVKVPSKAKYVRLQLLEEEDHGEILDMNENGYVWSMCVPRVRDIEVRYSKFYNCHRGAITNMPNNTYFHNNRLWNNGFDSGVDAPQFPDTTRYHWNNEEGYNTNITIEKNEFSEGFHGLLMISNNLKITDNTFLNTGGIAITKTNRAEIRGNRFINAVSGPLGCITINRVPKYRMYERDIIVEDNYFVGKTGFSFYNAFIDTEDNPSDLTKICFRKNTIDTESLGIVGSKIFPDNFIFSDNEIFIRNRDYVLYNNVILRDINRFDNNIISYLTSARYSTGNEALNTRTTIRNLKGSGNVFKGVRLYDPSNEPQEYIEGIEFIDCTTSGFIVPQNTTEMNITYKNCRFINTQITPAYFSPDKDVIFNLNLENVTIEYTDSFSIYQQNKGLIRELVNGGLTPNSAYNINLKNSTIINHTSEPLKLVSSKVSKEITVSLENVEYIGEDNFLENITINGEI